MAQKAKIVFTDDTAVIVDATVAEVQSAIAGGGIVSFNVSKKNYNYKLITINIGEKIEPAYTVSTEAKLVNAAQIQRVEAVDEVVAEVWTGTGSLEDSDTDTDTEAPTTDTDTDTE